MCSYPESRFGQCIRTCVISDLRFGRSLLSVVGPDLPLADAAHTHSSLRHDRPRTDSHVACLPVCRSQQYISMRDYLFRPCTPHNGMWHKWFVVYNKRRLNDQATTYSNCTILHTEAVITIIRSLNRQSVQSCIFISYLKNSFLWRNKLKGLC